MPLVVHPHFHLRRTGVTRHVETIVPALRREFEARAIGSQLRAEIPRIGWGELWRRLRAERVVWHAHRNNELLVGLLIRLFSSNLRVAFTRHSASRPGQYTRFLARRANLRVALTEEVHKAFG